VSSAPSPRARGGGRKAADPADSEQPPQQVPDSLQHALQETEDSGEETADRSEQATDKSHRLAGFPEMRGADASGPRYIANVNIRSAPMRA
jgi:hypothetical protein